MVPSGPFAFRLSELEEGEMFFERTVDAGELGAVPVDARVVGPIVVKLGIYRNGPRFEARGTVHGNLAQVCGRCLKDVPTAVDTEIRVFLEPRPSRDRRSEPEVREDDVGIVYHDGQYLDLTDEVRQGFLVEVPWHPLCRPDCLGLCPTCGVDRNEVHCTCHLESHDSRWDALRKRNEG